MISTGPVTHMLKDMEKPYYLIWVFVYNVKKVLHGLDPCWDTRTFYMYVWHPRVHGKSNTSEDIEAINR